MMATLLLLHQIVGCTYWKPSKLSPEIAVLYEKEARVDGQTVENPLVRNDSIVGRVADTIWAVPLSSVGEVRLRATEWWTIGVFSGALLAVTIAGLSTLDWRPASDDCDWPITFVFWPQ